MDRGAWWATVHGVAKSQTQLRAHVHTCAYEHWDDINIPSIAVINKVQCVEYAQQMPATTNIMEPNVKIWDTF